MGPEFTHIQNMTKVVALPDLLHILPILLSICHLSNSVNSLLQRNAIFATSVQVMSFAGPCICGISFDRAHRVVTVNVVAHLHAVLPKTE
jgi:hypothetical protein